MYARRGLRQSFSGTNGVRQEHLQESFNPRRNGFLIWISAREFLSGMNRFLSFFILDFLDFFFGFFTFVEIHDDQIGVVDCPWLGLMPIQIDKIVKISCNKVDTFVTHKETASSLNANLQNSWNSIKTLIMGRAIGAHRIICSTGKRTKKEWRKKFKVDVNSIQKLKKAMIKTTEKTSNTLVLSKAFRKRTYEICRGTALKRERKKQKITPETTTTSHLKSCYGITCDHKCKMWYPRSNFSINQIKSTSKQCQRCSRHMTALRKSKQILNDISKKIMNVNTTKFIRFIQSSCGNMQYNYGSCINNIKENLSPSPSSSALILEANKGTKISDGLKLTCNILCISIKKATNNFPFIDTTSIHSAIHCTNKILLCKESDFTLDREAETKIKLLIPNNNDTPCEKQHKKMVQSLNAITTPSKINQTSSSTQTFIPSQIFINEDHSKENPTKTTKSNYKTVLPSPTVSNALEIITNKRAILKDFAAQIIRPSRYMLGIEMTKAIEALRSFVTPDLYIASAEAANQIASWRLNQNWTSFARIFSSRSLIDNKLNGTYLIPMFSGDTSSGHWFLIGVRKLGLRNMKAWCVDSLGTRGSINVNVALKIETAFAPGRAKLARQACQCRCQEELECDPRTVLAMRIIQQNLANAVPIEECIQIATMQHAPYHGYTPATIREKVAYLVNRFMPSMIMPPIRLRNRNVMHRSRSSAEVISLDSDHSCIIIE